MLQADRRRVHGLNERTAVVDFHTALCVTRRAVELFGGVQRVRQEVAGSHDRVSVRSALHAVAWSS